MCIRTEGINHVEPRRWSNNKGVNKLLETKPLGQKE